MLCHNACRLLLLLLFLSGCGLFKNTTRNRQRFEISDQSQRHYTDTSITETSRTIDTTILIPASSVSLTTTIADLELQPLQMADSNGMTVQLSYQKQTGTINATVRRNAQAVPVKMQETTKQQKRVHEVQQQDVQVTAKTVAVERQSAVNWNLVVPVSVLILGVICTGCYFISKRFKNSI